MENLLIFLIISAFLRLESTIKIKQEYINFDYDLKNNVSFISGSEWHRRVIFKNIY